jgi:hypothetical protein
MERKEKEMTYSLYPAYAGPLHYVPTMDSTGDILDSFGLSTFTLPTPPNAPGSFTTPITTQQFILLPATPAWQRIATKPEGYYWLEYVSGGINEGSGKFNEGYLGRYSGGDIYTPPTSRVWVLGGTEETASPFFREPGFTSVRAVEKEYAGERMLFKHTGGEIKVAYDYDTTQLPTGSITFKLMNAPLPLGTAYWEMVYSSVPDTALQPKVTGSVVTNVHPGVHTLRFYVVDVDGKYSWVDYWIWAWKTPPRGKGVGVEVLPLTRDTYRAERYGTNMPMPWETMPTRPAKQTPPLRSKVEFKQTTSGNKSERPRSLGELPTQPVKLSINET